jgi:hypothetical protein
MEERPQEQEQQYACVQKPGSSRASAEVGKPLAEYAVVDKSKKKKKITTVGLIKCTPSSNRTMASNPKRHNACA